MSHVTTVLEHGVLIAKQSHKGKILICLGIFQSWVTTQPDIISHGNVSQGDHTQMCRLPLGFVRFQKQLWSQQPTATPFRASGVTELKEDTPSCSEPLSRC